MATLSFPRPITLENLCEFSRHVHELPPSDSIVFDAGPNQRITPTGIICLTKTCNRRHREHRTEQCKYSELENYEYANNLGFSDALSLKGRPYPQRAFGGENYIPISRMNVNDIESESRASFIPVGEVIERRCGPIAHKISQGLSPSLTKILAHLLREVFRNSYEHSGAPTSGYCMQYWPSYKEVEFCIADRGIGIRKSLSENKYLAITSDKEALLLSVMPGLSSKAWRHKKKKSMHKSEWDNAGYGLFQAFKLFGSLGHLMIASGQSALISRRGEDATTVPCNFEGAVISARIDLSDQRIIEAKIEKISREAAEVKARVGTRSVDIDEVAKYVGVK